MRQTTARSGIILFTWFTCILLSKTQAVQGTTDEIVVALTVSAQAENPRTRILSRAQLEGIKFWAEWATNTSAITTDKKDYYKVRVEYKEDFGSPENATEIYHTWATQNPDWFLIGPYSSDLSVPVSTNLTNKLLVGVTVGAEGFYLDKEASFSVTPASVRAFTVALRFYRTHGVKTVSKIVFDTGYSRSACGDAFDLQAEASGITPYNYHALEVNTITPEAQANWTALIENVIERNADGLVVCDTPPQVGFMFMLKEMQKKNWTPKVITTAPMSNEWNNVDAELREFITGSGLVSRNSRQTDAFFGSTNDFYKAFENYVGNDSLSNDMAGLATAAGLLLQESINKANSLDQIKVANEMKRINLDTFLGKLSFNVHNEQMLEGPFIQYTNTSDEAVVVGPLLNALATFIYPMPTWEERIFDTSFGNYISEWIILSCVLICVIISLSFGAFILFNINTKVIVGASPVFLAGIIIGSLMIYGGVLCLTPDNMTTLRCHLRLWLVFVGTSVLFGCLFAKTWRVYKIHKSAKKLESVSISNIRVALFAGSFAIGQIVLSLVYSLTLDESELVQPDPYRRSQDYYKCGENTVTAVVSLVQSIILVILLLVGAYLGFRVRGVNLKVFNESKVIGLATYNMTFFFLFTLIISITIVDGNAREAEYIVVSLCILLSAVGAVILLFYQKVRLLGTKTLSSDPEVPSIDHQLADISVHTMATAKRQDAVQKLRDENKKLRERIQALEAKKNVSARS